MRCETLHDRCSPESSIVAPFLLMIALLGPLQLFAQDSNSPSLAGVRTMNLSIESINKDAIAAGLDTAGLRIKFELRARELGINVVPSDSRAAQQGFLYFNALLI